MEKGRSIANLFWDLRVATPNSVHHKTWTEAKIFKKNMKFVNAKSSSVEYVPTLNNWVWTLEGIELLLKKIAAKYGVTSVWLRHLNQDPIENFFGSIRSQGCRNVNPTPDGFEAAFSSLLINSLSSVHAPGANCEVDNCHALHVVLITSGGCKEQLNCELSEIPDIEFTPLEDKSDPRIVGGLQYVSGYFIKTAKKRVFKGCSESSLRPRWPPVRLRVCVAWRPRWALRSLDRDLLIEADIVQSWIPTPQGDSDEEETAWLANAMMQIVVTLFPERGRDALITAATSDEQEDSAGTSVPDVTRDEVETAVGRLKEKNTALGPDGIPGRAWVLAMEALGPRVERLF
ncbi:unnamed protein product [Colias eurytheme]|nr:unnamed protein product [Colias eurytheme]